MSGRSVVHTCLHIIEKTNHRVPLQGREARLLRQCGRPGNPPKKKNRKWRWISKDFQHFLTRASNYFIGFSPLPLTAASARDVNTTPHVAIYSVKRELQKNFLPGNFLHLLASSCHRIWYILPCVVLHREINEEQYLIKSKTMDLPHPLLTNWRTKIYNRPRTLQTHRPKPWKIKTNPTSNEIRETKPRRHPSIPSAKEWNLRCSSLATSTSPLGVAKRKSNCSRMFRQRSSTDAFWPVSIPLYLCEIVWYHVRNSPCF